MVKRKARKILGAICITVPFGTLFYILYVCKVLWILAIAFGVVGIVVLGCYLLFGGTK